MLEETRARGLSKGLLSRACPRRNTYFSVVAPPAPLRLLIAIWGHIHTSLSTTSLFTAAACAATGACW